MGTVFRNALWRGYSLRLVQSVWSRFLFLRWHSTDIRVNELRVWFSNVWKYLYNHCRLEPSKAVPNLGSAPDSRFLQVFGVQRAAPVREPRAQPRAPERKVEQPPEPQLLLSAPTGPMDQDADGGAVVLVSQPTVQVAPGAGQGVEALVPIAEDPEAPQQKTAASQGAAQSEVVAVIFASSSRCLATMLSGLPEGKDFTAGEHG